MLCFYAAWHIRVLFLDSWERGHYEQSWKKKNTYLGSSAFAASLSLHFCAGSRTWKSNYGKRKMGGISPLLGCSWHLFYTAHTEQGDYTAYCLEPDKNFVPPGEYEPEMQSDNEGLRAALYYGYGGPGQGAYIDQSAYEGLGDSSLEDAKYVRTHLAVSYFFDREMHFTTWMKQM